MWQCAAFTHRFCCAVFHPPPPPNNRFIMDSKKNHPNLQGKPLNMSPPFCPLPQVHHAQQEDGLHCGARLHHGGLPGGPVRVALWMLHCSWCCILAGASYCVWSTTSSWRPTWRTGACCIVPWCCISAAELLVVCGACPGSLMVGVALWPTRMWHYCGRKHLPLDDWCARRCSDGLRSPTLRCLAP